MFHLPLPFCADIDLNQLNEYYGSSNEFIKSIYRSYKPNFPSTESLQNEVQLLASCSYDKDTKWGQEASPII